MFTPWRTLLTAAAVLLAATAWAQAGGPSTPPPTVAFCDLLSNPQAFDGQWIQVRGRVSVAFEDFSLRESDCDRPLTRSIWLAYGGDQESPITYCCGDHTRLPGKDISVHGRTVPLLRNAAMEDFVAKVAARRKQRVNGEPCDSSICNFYNVSATIVGLFFFAPNNPRNPQGGYGHLGCCHLLVIHRVSEVSAEPTPVPSDDTNFTCIKQTWQAESPTGADDLLDRQVASKRFLAQQMRHHGDGDLVEVMQNTVSKNAGITGTLVWTSPDLQTIYSAPFPQEKQKKKNARSGPAAGTITVTRERCVPLPEKRNQP
jgi:hypothetical protein